MKWCRANSKHATHMHDLSITNWRRLKYFSNLAIQSRILASSFVLIPWIKSTITDVRIIFYIIINCSCFTLEIGFKNMHFGKKGSVVIGFLWFLEWKLFSIKINVYFGINIFHRTSSFTNYMNKKIIRSLAEQKNVLKCIWMTMGNPTNLKTLNVHLFIYSFAEK